MSVEENNPIELSISEEDFWLNESFQNLQRAYQQNKFPHGLLIKGAKGFGQLNIAKAISASLLCATNSDEGNLELKKACGVCKSCLLLKANTHPDFNLVERLVEKSKLKKNISIDQIRSLSQKLVQTSQLQGWRIAIINSVEYMNIASFNAILKTLEEPGNNTLLILISEGVGAIPATIKSRCQLLNINADKEKTLKWLINRCQNRVEEEVVLNAMSICHGAPFASLEFMEKGFQNDYLKLMSDLDFILSNQLSANELIQQNKDRLEIILPWLANYFHSVSKSILLKKDKKYENVPNKTISELYNQLIDLNRAQSGGSNLQLALQLEAILIHWFELGRKIVHYSK